MRHFFDDFLSRTVGSIYVFDRADASLELLSRNAEALVAACAAARDPWIDLVTDQGEAVGFYALGNGGVVDPAPSFPCEDGMVFLVDGEPIPDSSLGKHLCPVGKLTDYPALRLFAPEELDLQTEASRREITLMTGRNRQEGQGRWKPKKSSFGVFSDMLRNHQEGAKDGSCFLQGESANGHRKSAAQIANHILCVDLDSGAPLEDVIAPILEHGLEATIYTTHSHLKDTSKVQRDHYLGKMGVGTPDEESLRQYLIEWKGVLPAIVETLEIVDDACHTEEGIVIVVRHQPMPKFRAVFVLDEPFVFGKRGGSQKDAILEWKERYAGFCTALGFFFDEKCVDPARLFYFPRHPKGNTSFGSWPIAGYPLQLDKFDRVKMQRRRPGSRPTARNAFSAAVGGQDDRDRATFVAECGFDLKGWAAQHAKRLEIQTLLDEVVGGEFIREPRQGKPGTHVECPFEAEHSDFGGSGTYVANASDNLDEGFEGGFTFHCVHNACAGRDRLEYLRELVDQGLITPDDLKDPRYLFELEEEERAVPAEQPQSPPTPSTEGMDDEERILHEFNARYAVVQIKGKVMVLQEPKAPGGEYNLLSVQGFKDLEAKRCFYRTGSKGGVTKVSMAKEWLEWEHRRDYDGIGFYPGGEAPEGTYNTFSGWPVTAKRGDWSLLQDHIFRNLCGGDDACYDFMIDTLADIFQRPMDKPGVSIVVTGEKGTGKSIVFDKLRHLLGRYATKVTHSSGITGNFNAHHEGKLLLVADEAVVGSDAGSEGVLKDLITSDSTMITRKGIDGFEAPNHMRLVIISNDDWVVRASSEERRFFVLKCGNENRQDHAFFSALEAQMKNGGYGAMLWDLLHHIPKNGWEALRKPPVTPHLAEQKMQSLSGIDKFMLNLLKDGGYEPSDGSQAIALREHAAKEIPVIDLRSAIADYLQHDHPIEKARNKVEQIKRAAAKWFDVTLIKRKLPGNINAASILVFPPLAGARANAERVWGIDFAEDAATFDGADDDEEDNVVAYSRAGRGR